MTRSEAPAFEFRASSQKFQIEARELTKIYRLGGNEVVGINRIDLQVSAG